MEFRKVLALRGPNMWANFPVLEAWLDLGALKDSPSDEIPGFNERLMAWLPTMIEHRCSVGTRGGFFERLRRGTYQGHILEHVALELQSLAGTEVGFGRTRQVGDDDSLFRVVVEYEEEELGRASLESARQLCLAAVHNRPFDVEGEVRKLREVARRHCPGPGTAAIIAACRKRKIPVRRLGPPGLLELGQGVQLRRVQGAQTDRGSMVAEALSRDRNLVRTLLEGVGVPIPEARLVNDAEGAWAAAEELGLPVVMKPRSGSGRRGVMCSLSTREQVLAAYETLAREGVSVLVERFAKGRDYRLLVVGGRVVAAALRGSTAGHEGNGRSAGAIQDVTERVHPEAAARAIDAARILGLDVAGVDVVAQDIARPLEEQDGVVVGVESRPGLRLHLEPSAGTARPVGEALVEHLFPAGQTGRIPIVGVTGVNGKTTTTRLIAHLVAGTGRTVGMTCTEGIHVGNRRIQSGDCSGPKSARLVLQHPQVEAAVLETARGGILREGLAFDRCDVAVVTNIGEGDHLGLAGIETAEDLARVKSTLVGAVARGGTAVLNAEDPLVAAMAEHCRGSVIYFARDASHPVLVQHRSENGRVVFVRDRQVVLAQGESETALVALERVPLTHGGRVGFQVLNVLAGAAASWALGLTEEAIRAGLESFAGRMAQVPGRFNLLDIAGTTVIVDYGHNVSSLRHLIEAIEQFPHRWRTAVYSAAGDRRDCDMVRQGEMLGAHFDRVILYEDAYRRGRRQGEIMALFRQGLERSGQRVKEVHEIHGGLKAVEVALESARPGELLVIQPDEIDPTVQYLERRLAAGAAGREVGLEEALATTLSESSVNGEELGSLVEVRPGRLGKGLFAIRPISRGQVLLKRWGPRTPNRSRHSVQVDEATHIIPLPPLHLIAHSCEPNCGLLVRREAEVLELHALRRIDAGEELTVDYATFEYDIEFLAGPCACKAPSCRGRVTGYKDLPHERRRAYGPYIAEYLREREDSLVEVR